MYVSWRGLVITVERERCPDQESCVIYHRRKASEGLVHTIAHTLLYNTLICNRTTSLRVWERVPLLTGCQQYGNAS